ncbi:hypothetical protein ACF0H5_019340 [Mactra antiquata]
MGQTNPRAITLKQIIRPKHVDFGDEASHKVLEFQPLVTEKKGGQEIRTNGQTHGKTQGPADGQSATMKIMFHHW